MTFDDCVGVAIYLSRGSEIDKACTANLQLHPGVKVSPIMASMRMLYHGVNLCLLGGKTSKYSYPDPGGGETMT